MKCRSGDTQISDESNNPLKNCRMPAAVALNNVASAVDGNDLSSSGSIAEIPIIGMAIGINVYVLLIYIFN